MTRSDHGDKIKHSRKLVLNPPLSHIFLSSFLSFLIPNNPKFVSQKSQRLDNADATEVASLLSLFCFEPPVSLRFAII